MSKYVTHVTVAHLIEALKDMPPDAAVYVWLNGERIELSTFYPVDLVDPDLVDLNVNIGN